MVDQPMNTYFNLSYPESERLMGNGGEMSPGVKAAIEISSCPITLEHIDGRRRISPLFLQVPHNRYDEMMIWAWGNEGVVLHELLLAKFKQQGFTGYRTNPATVRFRDGSVSTEYHEFLVTGWAGMASTNSGIRPDKFCPACHWKHYSRVTNADQLIEWERWTGDDFFIVWPMPLFILITERVAQWLLEQEVKSFTLKGPERGGYLTSKFGFSPGRLSDYLPADLAKK
jgi:hypothetical protein